MKKTTKDLPIKKIPTEWYMAYLRMTCEIIGANGGQLQAHVLNTRHSMSGNQKGLSSRGKCVQKSMGTPSKEISHTRTEAKPLALW